MTTISTSGDPMFGGYLWSKIILDFVADQLQQQHGIDASADPVEFFKLKQSCEAAKIALAGAKRVPVNFQAGGKALGGVLTRRFLQKSGEHLLDRLDFLLTDVRSQTGIEWTGVDHILLTGGTARMPIVRDFIVQHTGQGEKCAYLDPTTAPNGAALFARTQLEPDCGAMQLKLESVTVALLCRYRCGRKSEPASAAEPTDYRPEHTVARGEACVVPHESGRSTLDRLPNYGRLRSRSPTR